MNRCRTKYPILMLHGIAARDGKRNTCWGTIPYALNDEGARIFFGHQDAWGSIEGNAQFLKRRIQFLLARQACRKINIIAHSKGGLEARYLISQLGMADSVASLTTIATPHHGSRTMEKLCKRNGIFLSAVLNFFFSLNGDHHPDYATACRQLCASQCEKFNRENPDASQVYYQSYAAIMNRPADDMWMALPRVLVRHFDGEGDGMVSVSSAQWTNYKGTIPAAPPFGVSHANAAGIQRTPRRIHQNKYSSIREFYICLVEDLKNRGF